MLQINKVSETEDQSLTNEENDAIKKALLMIGKITSKNPGDNGSNVKKETVKIIKLNK